MTDVLVPAYGIDVSNRNGMFNWAPWKGHIQFAGIKCTEGLTFADPLYHQNMKDSAGLGGELYRFAYHYAHPELDPAKQAAFFVETAKPMMDKTDHFYLDLETTGELPPVDVSFWAWTFLTEVNRLEPGHRCLNYCDPFFADEGNCAKLGAWHLWVADYGVPRPELPVGPWGKWAMWQTSGSGVDRNQFNGNVESLREFCRTTGP